MRHIETLVLTAAMVLALPATAQVVRSDIAIVRDLDGKISEAAATPNAYLGLIAKKFYQEHLDRYDAIFVFSAIPLSFLTNVQQGWPVRQHTKGIGRMTYNMGSDFGSKGRLRQAVKMGDINILHDDPDKPYTGIPLYGLTGIELMGHEFGHQWLVSISFDKGDGQGKHCMARGWESPGENQLGDEQCDGASINGYNQHWSYYADSRSVMYGSTIEDQGGGQFRVRLTDEFKFSPLDQYLMGLRGPDEVPPMMIVDTGWRDGSGALPSTIAKDAAVTGTRVDVRIEDIIRAEGERDPPFELCHWKGVIILVDSPANPATPKMLDKLVRWGNRWEEYYSFATDGRGSFDLTLDGRGVGTVGCPSGTGPLPVDPSPEPMPDVVEPPQEVVTPTDVVQPTDNGPLPPDLAGIDSGDDPGEARDSVAPSDGTTSQDGTPALDVTTTSDGTAAQDGTTGLDGTASKDAVRPRDGTITDRTGEGGLPPNAICEPGVMECDGTVVRQCSGDGTYWGIRYDCAASNLVCLDGGTCGSRPKGGGCAAGSTTAPSAAWFLLVLPLLALVARRRAL